MDIGIGYALNAVWLALGAILSPLEADAEQPQSRSAVVAQASAGAITAFDGIWDGEGRLKSGAPSCIPVTWYKVTVRQGEISGKGGGASQGLVEFPVSGTVRQDGSLQEVWRIGGNDIKVVGQFVGNSFAGTSDSTFCYNALTWRRVRS